jgi:hypothetical protein
MAEVKFRDGPRDVAPHLAELMASLPTHRMTYDQAVHEVNDKLMRDHLNKVFGKVLEGDLFEKGIF